MIRLCLVIKWSNGEYEGCSRTAFSNDAAQRKIVSYADSKEIGYEILSRSQFNQLKANDIKEIKRDWDIDIKQYG